MSASTHGHFDEEAGASLNEDLLGNQEDGDSTNGSGGGGAADAETYLDAEGRIQKLQSPVTIDWQHVRTSLANERTFLAWIRTSMSIFSFGWAILKVQEYFSANQLHWYDEVVGYMFCLCACVTLVVGTQRFIRVRSALAFPESVVRFGRVGVRYIIAMIAVCFIVAFLRLMVNDIQSHYVAAVPSDEL